MEWNGMKIIIYLVLKYSAGSARAVGGISLSLSAVRGCLSTRSTPHLVAQEGGDVVLGGGRG